ncbi:MAG: GntR family transcriptional regulator [Thermomicrobiales bacterium]
MRAPLLYERLASHVLDEIRAGRLQPGDRVPSEKELAARFDVSRITSKRALETLDQAGVIIRIRGKGSFVAADLRPGDVALAARHGAAPVEQTGRQPARVGFVLPDLSDVYGVRLLDAIEERCGDLGFHLLLKRTYGSREVEEQAIRSFVAAGVDGLIVFPVHGEYYNVDLLRLVLDAYPVVLVDRQLRGIAASAVYTDNVGAARMLAGYLIDRGHRRIAFVSPPPAHTSSIEERIDGYRVALVAAGLPVDADLIVSDLCSTLPGAFHRANIDVDEARLRRFLDEHRDVGGIVACEYFLALLLDDVVKQRGTPETGWPEIVCFDSPEYPVGLPRFTYIRQDERAMGRAAVDALAERFAGGVASRRMVIDFTLVEGQATTAFPDLS